MAQQSDKWHHSMCRYLGLSSDTSFLFGIIPGVCREAIGRYDHMYTKRECFDSDKTYVWSEHHANKINNGRFSNQTAYYGTCPFLWDLGRVASQGVSTPEGSLFFLPRDDQVTIREDEYESVQQVIDAAPAPITFFLPWRSCDIWKNWDKLKLPAGSKFIQMNDPVTRQFILSKAFLEHQHIYIPWPGTDIYYAEFLSKTVHVYDKIEQYRTKKRDEMERESSLVLNYLKWGYDYLNDNQKEFFRWTRDWMLIGEDVRRYLTIKMLGLDVLKSPAQLYEDLIDKGFLEYNQKFVYDPEYQRAYEWLVTKTQEKSPYRSHHDHQRILLL